VLLARRGHFHFDAKSRANLPRIALATIGMALVLVALRAALEPALGGAMTMRLAALAGLIVAGLATFMALTLAFGVIRWRELRGQFRRLPA
jgi:putative peptidoglycan lipid II flippase